MNLIENEEYLTDLSGIMKYIPETKFTILITGATGLIGSCLIDALLLANEKGICRCDVWALGRSKQKLEERFSYAKRNEHLHFLIQDVTQSISAPGISVDYIINLASNADPAMYEKYPVETILTNVLGTKNILEFAAKEKSRKVLFTSSMEVYGSEIGKERYSENDYGKIDFNNLRAGYPESKRCAELLCRSYFLEYQVPVVIARLGYIYGPSMQRNDSKVVAQLLRSAVHGKKLVLNSTGLQKRSYLYVIDAVSATLQILFYGINGEAYNVAAENSTVTIRDLAKNIAQITGAKLKMPEPVKTDNRINGNVLDDKKLTELGWSPLYDLQEGLRQSIKILSSIES